MSFEKSLKYFKEHQHELAEQHHGKFVVICDGKVVDYFEDRRTAYFTAKERFPDKQFVLAECLRPEEEIKAQFHSRVA